MGKAWFASRYEKSGADYINCPLDTAQYKNFIQQLSSAQQAPVHGFEDKGVFEGCMPVEVMARRGVDTLRFGPMKPVGLRLPDTGKTPYAVVQLRKDNAAGSVYNMVGFQTHLTFPEQRRVFSLIPALEHAEFLRYGVMHRNSFLCSPQLLDNRYRAIIEPRVSFAGQLTGVEGYVESTASGLYSALSVFSDVTGTPFKHLPPMTATGALANYICSADPKNFQPMNINFGIMPPLNERVRGKRERNAIISERSLMIINNYLTDEP
jgi:methylenetetrahydrofolate--tRNA-(uracil-5-)-methyltransferase